MFLLDDGSGVTCAIDRSQASMSIKQCTKENGTYLKYEWSLCPGDTVYVIGDFVILRESNHHDSIPQRTGTTRIMRKPVDNQFHLISDHDPAGIAKNFKYVAYFYAFTAVACVVGMVSFIAGAPFGR